VETWVEEKEVIERFLATGTEEAFCELFEVACVRVRRYYLLRGLDAGTSEDLTQNVFVKVYRRAGELREPSHFYGWLFAIARNEMISYWRRDRARHEGVEFESLADQHADGLTTEPEVLPAMRMMDLLKSLEPAERDLVVLRFVEGLSYEELTLALNLPLGTVKWRIFNARKKLSRSLSVSSAHRTRYTIN
jgi:RNA polymerase sigma-70 factor (ECF subfamily)